MALPRLLPKRIFQLISVAILIGVVAMAIEQIAHGSSSYRRLVELTGSSFLGGLFTILLACLVAAVPIAVLRQVSTMPTFREELATLKVHSLADAKSYVEARKSAHQQTGWRVAAGEASPAERRRYHAVLAAGSALMAGLCALLAMIIHEVDPGSIPIEPLGFAIVATVAVPWHLVAWARARASPATGRPSR